jgi:hypothetical protein
MNLPLRKESDGNLERQQFSVLFHQKLLREAKERNEELMKIYKSRCDELQGDARFEPTQKYFKYVKLVNELIQANQKITKIENEFL